jgi:Ca2+-binding EF-hand superfamily protein
MSIFNQTNSIDKSKFEEIISEADQNGDGEISMEEFKVLMSKFF